MLSLALTSTFCLVTAVADLEKAAALISSQKQRPKTELSPTKSNREVSFSKNRIFIEDCTTSSLSFQDFAARDNQTLETLLKSRITLRGDSPLLDEKAFTDSAYLAALQESFSWNGLELEYLKKLADKESGLSNIRFLVYTDAQNPTSSAYGLFGFLNSTWRNVGIPKTDQPVLQIRAVIRYVNSRYGSFSDAVAFHRRNGYY